MPRRALLRAEYRRVYGPSAPTVAYRSDSSNWRIAAVRVAIGIGRIAVLRAHYAGNRQHHQYMQCRAETHRRHAPVRLPTGPSPRPAGSPFPRRTASQSLRRDVDLGPAGGDGRRSERARLDTSHKFAPVPPVGIRITYL